MVPFLQISRRRAAATPSAIAYRSVTTHCTPTNPNVIFFRHLKQDARRCPPRDARPWQPVTRARPHWRAGCSSVSAVRPRRLRSARLLSRYTLPNDKPHTRLPATGIHGRGEALSPPRTPPPLTFPQFDSPTRPRVRSTGTTAWPLARGSDPRGCSAVPPDWATC